jgi:hypothetical protein
MMPPRLCPDCGMIEGQFHHYGCSLECCPWCGWQLISCPHARWRRRLAATGRVPFIFYPWVCARCGTLDPAMFMVPHAEWRWYIELDRRAAILCRSCYDQIIQLIDAGPRGRYIAPQAPEKDAP